MMVLAHPATGDSKEAGKDTTNNLMNNFFSNQENNAVEMISSLTTVAIACPGLSPKASRVLPVDHAEMQDPETVQ